MKVISDNITNFLVNQFLDLQLDSRKIQYSDEEINNFIGMISSADSDTVRLAISIMSGMDPSHITKIVGGISQDNCSYPASLYFSDLTTLEELMMIWAPISINKALYEQKYPTLYSSGLCMTNISSTWISPSSGSFIAFT